MPQHSRQARHAAQDAGASPGASQNGDNVASASTNDTSSPIANANPHPGRVFLSRQYVAEEWINRQLLLVFNDPGKEVRDRFEGVDLIDSLVNILQLPIKTFDTACTFFHRLRLKHGEKDFLTSDAAIACLFVACKAEDTLKKSREILCACYNMKMQASDPRSDPRSPDDKIFEKPALLIQHLERLVLEAIGFDFRCRYPQSYMIKLLKLFLSFEEAESLYLVALDMSIDMYKTFMPLKNTTFGMAYSLIELSSRLTGEHVEKLKQLDPSRQEVPRMRIRQGMLDLLDLYTKHHKQTKLGAKIELDKFIQVKIDINNEIENAGPNALPRFPWPLPSNEDLHATPTPAGQTNVTNRFVFDVDEARREQGIVQQFMEDQYEEVEIEDEEEIREPSFPDRARDPRDPRDRRMYGHEDHGHGGNRGGHSRGGRHGEDGWSRGGRRNNNDRRRRGGRGGGGGGGGGW
ncbi:putative RNA polymerase II holoenzyme cyclin-like subunit [Seiridium cardinale]|uniref:RNA polymerase II holoenzyme cyclin-like subunit n=1 Tax=Seiridium cardinale TaxID=138064 RepID=A0ABR2XJK2_9PEZI